MTRNKSNENVREIGYMIDKSKPVNPVKPTCSYQDERGVKTCKDQVAEYVTEDNGDNVPLCSKHVAMKKLDIERRRLHLRNEGGQKY